MPLMVIWIKSNLVFTKYMILVAFDTFFFLFFCKLWKKMKKKILYLINAFLKTNFKIDSIARRWNEVLLSSIRRDQARPTTHCTVFWNLEFSANFCFRVFFFSFIFSNHRHLYTARNLFHTSLCMWESWRMYFQKYEESQGTSSGAWKKKEKIHAPGAFCFSSLLKSIFFLKKMLSFIQYQCLFIVLMQRSYGEPCRVQSRAARPFAKGRTWRWCGGNHELLSLWFIGKNKTLCLKMIFFNLFIWIVYNVQNFFKKKNRFSKPKKKKNQKIPN